MGYLELFQNKKLHRIADELRDKLSGCTLCPRHCRINRLKGEAGFCCTKDKAVVSSAFLHLGEEPEIVGRGGSGTIFFCFCNLGCLYCQNYDISHHGEGRAVDAQELCELMLALQAQGAENINFVTPTHVIFQIIEALILAVEKGLCIPLVYNCGGYESAEILKIIEGVFDIYMPDIKYADKEYARKFSQAPDYWEIVQAAVKEMHRQVGDLVVGKGVAKSGLLIRHLVLPNDVARSFAILDFIKNELGCDTYVNIMDQYHPCYQVTDYPELSRRITFEEYGSVVEYAHKIGLYRGFK